MTVLSFEHSYLYFWPLDGFWAHILIEPVEMGNKEECQIDCTKLRFKTHGKGGTFPLPKKYTVR